MTDMPSVSAIIPAYNAEAFITETLDHIREQMQPVQEVIVVDDGSTDSTAAIVRDYDDVRYLFQEHSGLSAALNHGIHEARNELLAFCDADDIWLEEKQALQLARLARFPTAEIILGHLQRIWFEDGRKAEPELMYSIGASLVRRTVFDKIGHFAESMDFYMDWEWFLRVKEERIRINIQPEVVTYYRQHATSLSAHEEHLRHNIAIMLKRAKDRKNR